MKDRTRFERMDHRATSFMIGTEYTEVVIFGGQPHYCSPLMADIIILQFGKNWHLKTVDISIT